MRCRLMSCFVLGLGSVVFASGAAAQNATPPDPPKVLSVTVEYLKPGVTSSQHAITEAAFAKTSKLTQGTQYIGMDSHRNAARPVLLCLRFVRGLGEGPGPRQS